MIAYALTESSGRTHLAADFMPTITFIEFDGTERKVDARTGTSFLRAAHLHGADLEGACGGALSCATCHLIFPDEWYRKFPAARADETAKTDAHENKVGTKSGTPDTGGAAGEHDQTLNPAKQ